jgi:hypothetical protein
MTPLGKLKIMITTSLGYDSIFQEILSMWFQLSLKAKQVGLVVKKGVKKAYIVRGHFSYRYYKDFIGICRDATRQITPKKQSE